MQLHWQCRRGMLELDLILNRFLAQHLEKMTKSDQECFRRLLLVDDPTLYAWLMGREAPVAIEMRALVSQIRRGISYENC